MLMVGLRNALFGRSTTAEQYALLRYRHVECGGGDYIDRGSGIIKITLGTQVPLANRLGPLFSGQDSIQTGLMTILNPKGYIYTYTNGGHTSLVIGRSRLHNAFDATK
ncbi:hypothetical protein BKA65DRAFT_484831 [Rhexocercosporidium sp. MPI-PUGE-AT-0058]|nr:hypothetical protein BKA65DRAFT_484831 [Rhexocercosporidium sp. MPI-PUGE-AT-0058]